MTDVRYQISAHFPDNSEDSKGKIIFDGNRGIRRYEAFHDAILANDMKRAHDLFSEDSEVLLLYHKNMGGVATDYVVEGIERQIGFPEAEEMKEALPILLKKDEEKLIQLAKDFKAFDEQSRRDQRVSSETLHSKFDY